jgi:alpha-D-xyloside xylohydrolase
LFARTGFRVFAGPTLSNAVQRYNLFAGGGCLPPLWGLGVYYRAHTEMAASDVVQYAQDFRVNHIPCDVFGLEPGTLHYHRPWVPTERQPNPF